MSGGAAACFGCGEAVAPELVETVGDAVFCGSCLGRMLRRVDERTGALGAAGRGGASAVRADRANGTPVASAGEGSPAERARIAKTAAADAPCFLCGDPLEDRAVIELHGFTICGHCARGLLGDEAPGGDDLGRVDRPVGDRAGDGAGGDASGAGVAPRAMVAIETPGSGTEWCCGCGRAMPGPGSYVLLDGRPHCAACAAVRARRSGSGSPAPASDDPAADDRCDACNRALGSAPPPEVQGFRLCAACLSSDPELALALARSRHQRRLARASRRILDGDGD